MSECQHGGDYPCSTGVHNNAGQISTMKDPYTAAKEIRESRKAVENKYTEIPTREEVEALRNEIRRLKEDLNVIGAVVISPNTLRLDQDTRGRYMLRVRY